MGEPIKIGISKLKHLMFKPYGRILKPEDHETPEVSEPGGFNFFITFRESSRGWQIGYLFNEARTITQLERHPNTAEVFSPLRGDSVLIVAEDPENEREIHAFKLASAIILHRGVWHGVLSLSEGVEILIVESPDVTDEFYQLSNPLTV